jgi:spermidine synthase
MPALSFSPPACQHHSFTTERLSLTSMERPVLECTPSSALPKLATPVLSRMPLWMPLAFCASGFAALIYQIVWQRVLFAAFGVNIEAVTVVVTAFLAGLGCGSFLGGSFAGASSGRLLLGFGALEIAIGLFGMISLPFFRWIGDVTNGLASLPRGAVTTLIIMVPTTLMGATLPLLVSYLVRGNRNVGRSVGLLYFVNTAGSAVAAFVAVLFLLGNLGETRSTLVAASVNLAVGSLVLLQKYRRPELA